MFVILVCASIFSWEILYKFLFVAFSKDALGRPFAIWFGVEIHAISLKFINNFKI